MRKTILEKAPGDNMPYNWDYSDEPDFAAPNPITAFDVKDFDGAALVGITVGAGAISSPIVQTQISGGTAGQVYYIRGDASNARGDHRIAFLELYVRIPVKDPAT